MPEPQHLEVERQADLKRDIPVLDYIAKNKKTPAKGSINISFTRHA